MSIPVLSEPRVRARRVPVRTADTVAAALRAACPGKVSLTGRGLDPAGCLRFQLPVRVPPLFSDRVTFSCELGSSPLFPRPFSPSLRLTQY